MKFTIAILTVLLAASWSVVEADARDRGKSYRATQVKKDRVVRHKRLVRHSGYYRRPSTVAANGLCQRDTGKPEDQLSFRNRCDTEEFWARIQERSFGTPW